jgi:hypothetical protein
MTLRVFIDGRQGMQNVQALPGNHPGGPMTVLHIGYFRPSENMDGFVDELRLSDTMRYTEDFTPPSREYEMRPDRHTLALFHFDGDIRGITRDGKTVEARFGR